MNEIQELIKHFVKSYDLDMPLENIYVDLVSEVGELGKELNKTSNYGKEESQFDEGLELELGDIMYSLIAFANKLDIDLFSCLKKAIIQYKERYAQKGTIGNAKKA